MTQQTILLLISRCINPGICVRMAAHRSGLYSFELITTLVRRGEGGGMRHKGAGCGVPRYEGRSTVRLVKLGMAVRASISASIDMSGWPVLVQADTVRVCRADMLSRNGLSCEEDSAQL
jgi:hypothetical protein